MVSPRTKSVARRHRVAGQEPESSRPFPALYHFVFGLVDLAIGALGAQRIALLVLDSVLLVKRLIQFLEHAARVKGAGQRGVMPEPEESVAPLLRSVQVLR